LIFSTSVFIFGFAYVYFSPSEKYRLTSRGVHKMRGNRKRFYPWNRFASYYIHPSVISPSKEGKLFLLVKRNKIPIIPSFVFTNYLRLEILAEPDNYNKVEDFIKNHLKKGIPEGKHDELLLVLYFILIIFLMLLLERIFRFLFMR
jgi:hypothetical protein